VIARTSAAAASSLLRGLPSPDPDDVPAAAEDGDAGTAIEPFGVFDPLAHEKEPW
jgi:hypothetical protein